MNRRIVDNAGIVRFRRLRSPGANAQSVACVADFVGEGFYHGEINIGNAGMLVNGHFIQNGSGWLSREDGQHTMNGVRPALWLTIILPFDMKNRHYGKEVQDRAEIVPASVEKGVKCYMARSGQVRFDIKR